jgi:hypothetical protein
MSYLQYPFLYVLCFWWKPSTVNKITDQLTDQLMCLHSGFKGETQTIQEQIPCHVKQ